MLAAPDHPVQRKASLKAKLRSISINRHKLAPGEESHDSVASNERRRSSTLQVPDGFEDVEETGRSRARSPARTALMDTSTDEQLRPDSTSSSATLMPQAVVAAPIVTPSIVTSIERPSSEGHDTATINLSTPVAILETVKGQDEAVEPASVAGGFLSSVLNAATNFGTVLGANSPRSVTVKSPKQANDNFQASPGRASTVQSLGTPILKQEDLGTPGELSLKDMGITDVPSTEPVPESRSRASSRTTTTAQTAIATDAADPKSETRPIRSGSVVTTQSRRRRGSTAMSVFSGADGLGQKITGFAVASNKRNREFHATFRSVPDADYLLDDYGCALQKEILVHGRMYVSESHICFNSNIFGWVTNLVISFVDITALEKKSTAGIFPNAIQVSTQQAKHVFASFISRDTTFDLIVNIWRLTHPSVQSTAHGVEVAGTEGDDLYESDSDESLASDEDDSPSQSAIESDDEDVPSAVQPTLSPENSPQLSEAKQDADISAATNDATGFPGPREHLPTEAPSLTDGTAFAKALIDECFSAPLGRVYDLLYGNDTSFMQDFLTSNQKLLDVQVGQFSDKQGKNVRPSSYVKPLSGPIGPKQTRCLLEDVIELKDFNKCIQVVQTTTSPDVPSGDAFAIKTRFSLMWGPRNTTRLVANCVIEWSKNSWIKGPIEKASNAGQVQFMADLSEALKSHLSSGSSSKKKKTKTRRTRSATEDQNTDVATVKTTASTQSDGVFGSILGIVHNINVNVLTLILLFGMMFAMVRMQSTIRELASQNLSRPSGPSLAGYNWQREETDLWAWLAERTLSTESGTEAFGHGKNDRKMTRAQIHEALAQARIQAAVLEEAEQMASKADL